MITARHSRHPGADVRHPPRGPLRRAPLGLLPAATDAMTDGAAGGRPHELTAPWRGWCLLAAARRGRRASSRRSRAPPGIPSTARHCSSPSWPSWCPLWSHSAPRGDAGLAGDGSPGPLAARRPGGRPPASAPRAALVARLHRRRPGRRRGLARTGAVAAVAEHGWLVPLEGVTLLVFGLGLWLELVTSPPLVPRSGYLRRAVLAAFVCGRSGSSPTSVGLSNHDFYRNFPHVGGWPQRGRRPADRLRRALVRGRRLPSSR